MLNNKKGISLIILVLIIVFVVVVGAVSIILVVNNNSNNDNNESSINMGETNKPDNKNENNNENNGLLTKSTLSLYNPNVKSSNYLSMVVYDPQKTRLSSGDKDILEDTIVVVTEFDKDIYSDFFNNYYKAIVNNNNSVYRYSLGTDKKVISSVICTNNIDDISATIYDIERYNEGEQYYGKSTNAEIINGSSYDKDYKNEYMIYGDTWKVTKRDEASSIVDLLIANTETKNYYMSVNITEKLLMNNSNINKIDQMIKNNNFENSIYFIKNSDDFSTVSKYYGKEIDLKNTIVYQDAIATQISNEFGLNVRDKDYFVHSDNVYIEYKAYGSEDYLVDIKFTGINKTMDYSEASNYYEDSTYSYNIDGIKYEYMANNTNGIVYVFKDTEYVGSIDVDYRGRSSTDSFKHRNELFGIKK